MQEHLNHIYLDASVSWSRQAVSVDEQNTAINHINISSQWQFVSPVCNFIYLSILLFFLLSFQKTDILEATCSPQSSLLKTNYDNGNYSFFALEYTDEEVWLQQVRHPFAGATPDLKSKASLWALLQHLHHYIQIIVSVYGFNFFGRHTEGTNTHQHVGQQQAPQSF